MKIAIAHDSFTQMGGAERVVDALHELLPDAPVFTLVYNPIFAEKYKGWEIRTSGLQTLYLALGKLQYLLPLIPWGVDNLDFSGFDLVISSSSGWIKNIRVPKNCIHINYCHTPTRFLWSESDYIKQEVPWWQRPFVKAILKRMKRWDYNGAQRVTKFIANSKEVQKRIKEYYHRDSEVIYPFVDKNFWYPMHPSRPSASESRDPGSCKELDPGYFSDKALKNSGMGSMDKSYFLLAGRLHAHKKSDLIIEIFNDLNIPLHVVGDGRQLQYLKSIAKPNVKFFGRVTDEELREQYSGAKALIFPQTEDFGLTVLEAAACGTPALAYAQGGALETIIPGVTGEFFDSYDKEQIKQMITGWNSQKYQEINLLEQAKKFSKEIFKQSILKVINHYNG